MERQRAHLSRVAAAAELIDLDALTAALRPVRAVSPRGDFEVVASFLGAPQLQPFELQDAFGEALARRAGGRYLSRAGGARPGDPPLSFRLHVADGTGDRGAARRPTRAAPAGLQDGHDRGHAPSAARTSAGPAGWNGVRAHGRRPLLRLRDHLHRGGRGGSVGGGRRDGHRRGGDRAGSPPRRRRGRGRALRRGRRRPAAARRRRRGRDRDQPALGPRRGVGRTARAAASSRRCGSGPASREAGGSWRSHRRSRTSRVSSRSRSSCVCAGPSASPGGTSRSPCSWRRRRVAVRGRADRTAVDDRCAARVAQRTRRSSVSVWAPLRRCRRRWPASPARRA